MENQIEQANYNKMTVTELKAICKQKNIKGISKKTKNELIDILEPPANIIIDVITNLRQDIIHGDTIKILPTLDSNSAQIIIADPPYNIGKDFGNNSDNQDMNQYLLWCEEWIKE